MSKCPKFTFNIDVPRHDQDTFTGRLKHFFEITNPLNLLTSNAELERCRDLVEKYRLRQCLPTGTTEEDLWRAKVKYDSAFHPDTGEKMNFIGRMSAQVPMNTFITAGMLTFYQTNLGVLFWQWFNQSFNAIVNFTNRSGDATYSNKQIGISYVLATSGAVGTAFGLNKLLVNSGGVVKRLVPFAAVVAANCINVPCMRAQELKDGTPIFDASNKKLGNSKNAAQKGIAQVVTGRVVMAIPGMVSTPFIMNYLENNCIIARGSKYSLPINMGLVVVCLTFGTPFGCAVFKQRAELAFDKLEPTLQEQIKKTVKPTPQVVYFNKGL